MYRAAVQRLVRRLLVILALAFAGTVTLTAQPRTLRIAAAADLQPVLPAIATAFQAQTGVQVEAVYASSATLANQILNGGPFDLFLAADVSFPNKVIAGGMANSPAPIPYALGSLVLWSRRDSPAASRGSLTVDALRSASLSKVAVANPQHAPYGRAAIAAIRSLGLADHLKGHLVFAENVAQAAQYAESGNADLGLISLTSALTPRLKSEGSYVEMPPSSYPPILQAAVVVKNSAHLADAERFLEFLKSASIRKRLAAEGLKAP